MGGYGSTRWGGVSKKTQVEETLKLTVKPLKQGIKEYAWPGWGGSINWSRNGKEFACIKYQILGGEKPERLRLMYTINAKTATASELDYEISLESTRLYRGGLQYWMICPLCGYRAGCLYLATGGKKFACRHCYKLSYASRQEGYKDNVFYKMILAAAAMSPEYSKLTRGLTRKDINRLLK